jgi:prepilin-type N-terminal cleavage/methylation domain-containing protein
MTRRGAFIRRRPGAPGARADEGFTLIEMTVAVAVLAAMVAVIPRSLVAARTNFERSQDWLHARLVAEQVLNEELAGASLEIGTMRGRIDGRAWSAVLDPISALSSTDPQVTSILLNVRVSVAVTGGETLDLSTVRIGLRND